MSTRSGKTTKLGYSGFLAEGVRKPWHSFRAYSTAPNRCVGAGGTDSISELAVLAAYCAQSPVSSCTVVPTLRLSASPRRSAIRSNRMLIWNVRHPPSCVLAASGGLVIARASSSAVFSFHAKCNSGKSASCALKRTSVDGRSRLNGSGRLHHRGFLTYAARTARYQVPRNRRLRTKSSTAPSFTKMRPRRWHQGGRKCHSGAVRPLRWIRKTAAEYSSRKTHSSCPSSAADHRACALRQLAVRQ